MPPDTFPEINVYRKYVCVCDRSLSSPDPDEGVYSASRTTSWICWTLCREKREGTENERGVRGKVREGKGTKKEGKRREK